MKRWMEEYYYKVLICIWVRIYVEDRLQWVRGAYCELSEQTAKYC